MSNSDKLKVVFTGGGTAGHVLPNVPLIKEGLRRGWQVSYFGSQSGIERELIGKLAGVAYHPIATGKLRRYFSWQNFSDLLKVMIGILQSLYLLYRLSPQVVFSKGGYVGLPVTVAAWFLRIPVIVHESDLTVGLANRIAFAWASRIALNFEQALHSLPTRYRAKAVVTGMPVRSEFKAGDNGDGDACRATTAQYWLPASDARKPFVVIFGGSLGAAKLNEAVRAILPQMLKDYRVLHVCGRGNVQEELQGADYQQFEYIDQLFPMALQAADIVVSRAGATAIYELLYLGKPHILVPLASGSRGDQLVNARYFAGEGCSMLLEQAELIKNPEQLLRALDNWRKNPASWQHALKRVKTADATLKLIALIEQLVS